MNFIIVKPQLSKEELIELIIKEFPPTKEDILDEIYEGLIHLQVGVLADYTNQCIQKSRFDEVSRIFQFFDAVIDKVDSETDNAFYVSFLEHIDMDDGSNKQNEAIKLLPKKYLEAYKGLRNFS
ncbi:MULTISPECIES: DUF7674 family protein [Roseivirga]|uniref:DUF7674 domain-containing protein n=1 Tax=Roseivirga spongicola TaxID=333140 RepID=A0A150XB42_9BACT|nr:MULTISPECIES: hypothetical protein [Roseivirga]KYG75949.1 hypothetical protein AWW68_08965 [Roseivirga spongicola]MBO6659124.1 hypothetical protein [Roseivirga sp.]MBO6760367.1 hypothetical protein [Roseivirga sp.]MBO6908139.1 hypothetical protein [Roseivirga sp.]WPZ10478.1 hypothetical protein T7867_00020 [Roseivirga spongicola]|tara:strand:+ start:234 stop:605 length:372 start_codon:yes stop_codon:yes gene_type:complete